MGGVFIDFVASMGWVEQWVESPLISWLPGGGVCADFVAARSRGGMGGVYADLVAAMCWGGEVVGHVRRFRGGERVTSMEWWREHPQIIVAAKEWGGVMGGASLDLMAAREWSEVVGEVSADFVVVKG